MSDYRVVEPITVSIDGLETVWSLDQRADQDSQWTLVLTAPDGATWTATAQGLWNAFVELRRQTDPLGYKLCCAAARIDVIMRKGRDWNNDVVYILSRRTLLGIHHKALMLDHAPASTIGTVDEQEARYDRFLATPWWRALLPGAPVR
ncbi:hypothetical protein [Kribbella sp. NPDC049227]|uniref:hypothetical protein n=1 Tax=Kribbella sp. NPDC049227 TaxID=3364113 RepID=UPI003712229E